MPKLGVGVIMSEEIVRSGKPTQVNAYSKSPEIWALQRFILCRAEFTLGKVVFGISFESHPKSHFKSFSG